MMSGLLAQGGPSSPGSPSPFVQPPPPGLRIPEIVTAAILVSIGLWSLAKWMRTEFEGESRRDRLLFALYAASRVGLWFSFAALFLGFALLDEPWSFRWFVLVPIALAGVQLMSGLFLSRGSGVDPPGGGGGSA